MSRVVVSLVFLLSLGLIQAQEKEPPAAPSVSKPDKPSPLIGTAQTLETDQAEADAEEKSLKRIPKKIVLGGTLIQLLSKKQPNAEDSSSDAVEEPIQGWKLLSPFAPLTPQKATPKDWTERARFSSFHDFEKDSDFKGIQLFSIGF